jgi:hypothetical protein
MEQPFFKGELHIVPWTITLFAFMSLNYDLLRFVSTNYHFVPSCTLGKSGPLELIKFVTCDSHVALIRDGGGGWPAGACPPPPPPNLLKNKIYMVEKTKF